MIAGPGREGKTKWHLSGFQLRDGSLHKLLRWIALRGQLREPGPGGIEPGGHRRSGFIGHCSFSPALVENRNRTKISVPTTKPRLSTEPSPSNPKATRSRIKSHHATAFHRRVSVWIC